MNATRVATYAQRTATGLAADNCGSCNRHRPRSCSMARTQPLFDLHHDQQGEGEADKRAPHAKRDRLYLKGVAQPRDVGRGNVQSLRAGHRPKKDTVPEERNLGAASASRIGRSMRGHFRREP